MHPIGLCLSTGRSGTTYLARALAATYGDTAHVFHEDIDDPQSKPRRYLHYRGPDDLAQLRSDPDIATHLARIERLAATDAYIDVGHPAMAIVPLVIATFPKRVRLVHLVREPVSVAASYTTMGQYDPNQADTVGLNPWLPDPTVTRCAHPVPPDTWAAMTPFEKNLWRWGEYQLAAVEIHRDHPEVPFLRVSSDELFRTPDTVARIAAFYGLEPRSVVIPPRSRNEANPNLTVMHSVGPEWKRYTDYPWILDLARELGVPVPVDGLEERMRRYAAPSAGELFRYRWRQRFTWTWIRNRLRRLFHRPPATR